MLLRASSLRTIAILRETLESFECRPGYDPTDPVFINLRCRILCWITELYVLAARDKREDSRSSLSTAA